MHHRGDGFVQLDRELLELLVLLRGHLNEEFDRIRLRFGQVLQAQVLAAAGGLRAVQLV